MSSKLELKSGGVYHYGIRMPDGQHPFSPRWPLELLTTVTFQDFGPKTLIALFWEPLCANAEELKAFSDALPGMHQGWGGTFEQLDAHLKEKE